MSHFSVMIVTDSEPTEDSLKKILEPFHEFESTGLDDEYVIEAEETEYYKEKFSKGEGKEYLNKSGLDHTFKNYLAEYCSIKPVPYMDDIDLAGDHKYSYFLVGYDGEVVKVVRRTNPNSKWDYWVVGGRYSNRLMSKSKEGKFNTLKFSDVDFDRMKASYVEERRKFLVKLSVGFDSFEELMDCHLARENAIEEFTKAKKADSNFSFAEFDSSIDHSIKEKINRVRKNDPWSDFKATAGQTEDEWLNDCSALTSYAMIVDGKWISQGEMGWFGISSNEDGSWEEKQKELIGAIKPEQWITIVDCHI